MITSLHAVIYSDDPPATRAFLRDVLGWPYVEDADSEPGWLIFAAGRSEIGIHPTQGVWEGKEFSHSRQHQISLMCDDIETTRADLEAKGCHLLRPHRRPRVRPRHLPRPPRRRRPHALRADAYDSVRSVAAFKEPRRTPDFVERHDPAWMK